MPIDDERNIGWQTEQNCQVRQRKWRVVHGYTCLSHRSNKCRNIPNRKRHGKNSTERSNGLDWQGVHGEPVTPTEAACDKNAMSYAVGRMSREGRNDGRYAAFDIGSVDFVKMKDPKGHLYLALCASLGFWNTVLKSRSKGENVTRKPAARDGQRAASLQFVVGAHITI